MRVSLTSSHLWLFFSKSQKKRRVLQATTQVDTLHKESGRAGFQLADGQLMVEVAAKVKYVKPKEKY